jgi:hypothetical protein
MSNNDDDNTDFYIFHAMMIAEESTFAQLLANIRAASDSEAEYLAVSTLLRETQELAWRFAAESGKGGQGKDGQGDCVQGNDGQGKR